MRKLSVVMFLPFILCTSIYAELIDGPANFRDKPNGKIAFSLSDNVDIDTSKHMKNDWLMIGAWVYVDKNTLIDFNKDGEIVYGDTKIKKGTTLYDDKGNKIGILYESVNFTCDSEYDKKTDMFYAYIYGYTYKGNIRWNTSIESQFEELFNSNDSLDIQFYEKNKLGYYHEWGKDWDKEGNFRGFVCDESLIDDPSPAYRIALVFYKNKLAAILHSRPLNLKKYKDKTGTNNYIIINNNLGSKLDDYCHNIMMYSGQ